MSNDIGQIPAKKLDELLRSVMEWADHATDTVSDVSSGVSGVSPDDKKHATEAHHALNKEEGRVLRKQSKSAFSMGNIITSLVSAIALLFSGYSFYETVLKDAQLKIYAPALIHMYRSNFRDVLAIPLTISNDGAKRGTILSIDLKVTNPETNESKTFKNLYFGNDPRDTSRIFTPLTMSGRSSHSDVIMFFANTTGAFFKTTGGVKSKLHFEMKIIADETEHMFKSKKQTSLSFDMTAKYIQSFQQMEKGVPTVYYKEQAPKAVPADSMQAPDITPEAD